MFTEWYDQRHNTYFYFLLLLYLFKNLNFERQNWLFIAHYVLNYIKLAIQDISKRQYFFSASATDCLGMKRKCDDSFHPVEIT